MGWMTPGSRCAGGLPGWRAAGRGAGGPPRPCPLSPLSAWTSTHTSAQQVQRKRCSQLSPCLCRHWHQTAYCACGCTPYIEWWRLAVRSQQQDKTTRTRSCADVLQRLPSWGSNSASRMGYACSTGLHSEHSFLMDCDQADQRHKHTFPLSDLAVHVISCKVHFKLPAIEIMLVQVPYCALCCLSIKELKKSESLLLPCVPVCHNPAESGQREGNHVITMAPDRPMMAAAASVW